MSNYVSVKPEDLFLSCNTEIIFCVKTKHDINRLLFPHFNAISCMNFTFPLLLICISLLVFICYFVSFVSPHFPPEFLWGQKQQKYITEFTENILEEEVNQNNANILYQNSHLFSLCKNQKTPKIIKSYFSRKIGLNCNLRNVI